MQWVRSWSEVGQNERRSSKLPRATRLLSNRREGAVNALRFPLHLMVSTFGVAVAPGCADILGRVVLTPVFSVPGSRTVHRSARPERRAAP